MPLRFYYPIGSLATLLMCVQALLVLGGLSKGGGDCLVNDSGTSKCIYHSVAYCPKWRGDYGKPRGLSMTRRKYVWEMHNKMNKCYSQNKEKGLL